MHLLVIELFVILLLLVANWVFVMTEMAVVSARKAKKTVLGVCKGNSLADFVGWL